MPQNTPRFAVFPLMWFDFDKSGAQENEGATESLEAAFKKAEYEKKMKEGNCLEDK